METHAEGCQKHRIKFIKPGFGKNDLDTGLSEDLKFKARTSEKGDIARIGNEFQQHLHAMRYGSGGT